MKNSFPTLVVNTGPIISLIAATGDLEILKNLYSEVHVPLEVAEELTFNNSTKFGAEVFSNADFLLVEKKHLIINPMLLNSLDTGEASVIQLALNKSIDYVSIDEAVGRRIARLNALRLNGSLGILVKAKKIGIINSVKDCLTNMKEKGIYLSDNLIAQVLNESGE